MTPPTPDPHPFNQPVCAHCGLDRTPEGHDGCIGTLPGNVMNACCNHGGTGEGAYIQYWDGTIIADEDAVKVFDEHRNQLYSVKRITP